MKKINLSIYVTVFIATIFAFGCQPEPVTPPTPTPNTTVCRSIYSTLYSATGAYQGRDTILFDAQNKYLGRRLGIALITDYVYDAQNRVISVKGLSSGSTQEHKYMYDANNRRSQDDIYSNGFKGVTLLYQYDASNRVSRTTRGLYGSGGTISGRDTTNFTYTGSNLRPARIDFRGGHYTYSYDANGNKTSEMRYDAQGLIATFTYTFDNKKNPAKSYSFGATLFPGDEILDTNNQLSRTENDYDTQGNITNTSTSNIGTFEYNSNDYPSKLTRSDGTYAVFTYQCP
jgi:YD repeat-containing protein